MEVQDDERVVWIDSDILINPATPCLAEGVLPEEVGAVEDWSSPSLNKP